MYAAQLRQKSEFRHLKRPTYSVDRYSKIQSHQLENLRKEMELKQVGRQSNAMREKLLQHRDKINYQNELDRIRGELSKYGTRLSPGTRKRLNERVEQLKKLGGSITN